ncbi:Fe-S oxidoreductase [Desulfosporosinus orientis DSM 765]|uniref:Glycolate oxidase iron-sulfur subunit n=1 Tax=Desulfosporosinus orientis (strain ATCC 19365 / DSM 765 / NCIMB 8382 / VKM B-1628 / Singapore I) TaxID=768706 RepID=G7WAM5_DESOD|nr:(Fe-S)-binding protein [Desulfosporosinus orientis]AET66793.1 Fe-S oxidoreductase [Desulfosporosinus orientis DSM 765]
MNELRAIHEMVSKCARCGDCQSVCPIYRETKREGSVARGRLSLLRFVSEEELPFDGEVKDRIYECLMCGSCEANCSSKVPVTDILFAAKEALAKGKGPLIQQLMFKHFLPYPGRLKLTNRLLKIYQNTGLRALLRKSGIINVLGPLAKAEDIIPQITPTFRDQQGKMEKKPKNPKHKIGFFLGCASNILKPDQAIAAVNMLRKMGCQVEVPETICCGLPVVTYGRSEIIRELAKKNIEILLQGDYEYVVSDCVSCSSQLIHYPKFFNDDDPYYEKALELSSKVIDFAHLLSKIDQMKKLSNEKQTITFHVPCHMARGLKAVQESKEILKSIQGIKYVELPDADTCCGAAGSYLATHPDLSKAVLRRKMENIRATGANVVVTSCPMCVMQLERGAKLFDVPVEVRHLAEIVSETLK